MTTQNTEDTEKVRCILEMRYQIHAAVERYWYDNSLSFGWRYRAYRTDIGNSREVHAYDLVDLMEKFTEQFNQNQMRED